MKLLRMNPQIRKIYKVKYLNIKKGGVYEH